MISTTQRARIRHLLKTGISAREIARQLHVAHKTVDSLRDEHKMIRSLRSGDILKIQLCLKDGMTPGEIESKYNIARTIISAIKRYNSDPAGEEFSPIGVYVMKPSPPVYHTMPVGLEYDAAIQLYHLAEDLVALANMGSIENPLFTNLASDAKEILSSIEVTNP